MTPASFVLGPIMEIGSKLIDRWFPDPAAKAAAELELFKLTQSGDLQTLLAQLAINAKEAENPNLFVSGWRPFIGWVCGFGFVYHFILHNILEWVAEINKWPVPPAINSDALLYVLGALLGIGGLRTFEKVKGVASK